MDGAASDPSQENAVTSHYQKRELLRLARSSHIPKLQQLLETGLDINFIHGKTGMSPLMTAANAGQTAAVELLLRYGADPNLRADDNASALHWACKFGDVRIVEMLLDAGAEVNIRRCSDRGEDGPAPIHMAISNQQHQHHEEVAKKLIDAGASLDIEYLGRTVLQYAEWHGCHQLADYLRQRERKSRRVRCADR